MLQKDHWHNATDVHTFNKIFRLKLVDFIDFVGGFDIIKLDHVLKVPDGISTRNFIQKKYGIAGVTLIEKFIKY